MAFRFLVKVTAVVAEDRPGINAGVDTEESHSDALQVAPFESPETSMSVAVFRTDARVHDKGAGAGLGKDGASQDVLAAGDDKVRGDQGKELFNFRRVWGSGKNNL